MNACLFFELHWNFPHCLILWSAWILQYSLPDPSPLFSCSAFFYGFLSVIIKYDIYPVTGSTFIKNFAKHSFSNSSKCLLITFQTLDKSHPTNCKCRGLGNGISSLMSFWSSFAMDALFVLRIKPSGVANDHRRGPRGWDDTSLICKFLLSVMTIIWANNLLSALRITTWFWPALSDVFLFSWVKVFSIAVVIVLWNLTLGGLDWSRFSQNAL